MSIAARPTSSASGALVALLAAVLLDLSSAARVAGHPFLDDRIVLLDERIAAEPANARLLLSRGSLYLDERQPREALTDFERALELDPELAIVHLLRAQALLADGQVAAALEAARRYVALEPGSAKGWRTLARIEDARLALEPNAGLDEALAAFERYFELATDPRPDDYLERADLQRRAGRLDPAVAGLEAGAARLGPLTVLLRTALEIERGRGRLDAALAWADRLVVSSPQTERWLLERARLLSALGRDGEALSAVGEAEAALASRSAARRSAPAWAGVEQEIHRLKGELAPPSGTSSAGTTPGRLP